MHENSKSVFMQLVQDESLPRMRRYILAIIAKHPNCTDKEISKYSGLSINRVTPRRGELARTGRILCTGVRVREVNGRRIKENEWVFIG